MPNGDMIVVKGVSVLWRRQWHPTPVLLPGKSFGRRSLVGCSPWGHEESDMTEWLHFHFSLSCIGEGNGNPLQCSCLENPRDGEAWWAAVRGVTQSRTQLKQLSMHACIGEGNVNPLHYSCLENPRDGGAWWAAVCRVTCMYWRRKWQPTPGFLPGESHGQRSLVGCSPWGCKESDMTDTT